MSISLATISTVSKPRGSPAVASLSSAELLQPAKPAPVTPDASSSHSNDDNYIQNPLQSGDATPDNDPESPLPTTPATQPSKTQGVAVIVTLAGISFLNTMGSGILVAALPRIAHDVGLSDSLILWPAAVYALAAGCCLLLFGAAADAIGAKPVWVVGSFLFVAFTVALGLARTGLQIIVFRTFLGVAIAMCLPTAVSLITSTFPRGHWRNTAFAMNGMGQPLGYALGLVLGGIFTDTIGWRWAYYMMALINFVLSMVSIWSLPSTKPTSTKSLGRRLAEDIDWVGAFILSAALGLLMYDLAIVTTSWRSIQSAQSIAILTISILLLICFPAWMHFQTQHGRPALIPNSLWKNASFTTICVAVFFCWASLNGLEYFTTL